MPWLLEEPEDLWQAYREPILAFFEEAQRFDRILSDISGGGRPSELDALRHLLEPVGPDIICATLHWVLRSQVAVPITDSNYGHDAAPRPS